MTHKIHEDLPHILCLFREWEIPVTRFTFVFAQNEKSTLLPEGVQIQTLPAASLQRPLGTIDLWPNFFPKGGTTFLQGPLLAPLLSKLRYAGRSRYYRRTRPWPGYTQKVDGTVALTVCSQGARKLATIFKFSHNFANSKRPWSFSSSPIILKLPQPTSTVIRYIFYSFLKSWDPLWIPGTN